jgi:outer membrane protein assembly factor BamB
VAILALASGWLGVVPFARSQDVLTWHNDIARTGQNLNETILTPGNVKTATFGKLFVIPVDGKVDAQPLFVTALPVPGKGVHNLLVVATEHASVYAFDADTGVQIWQTSALQAGETPSDPRGCNQVVPEIGISGTPVIDRAIGANGAIYLTAMSKNSAGTYFQRLHALDLATGAELFGGPKDVQASFPGSGDNSSGGFVIFDPGQYKQRPGLLLLNGTVYTAWGSHCDNTPYTGWIIGYNESTLAQTTVLNVVPNGSEGGIWGSGAGPAVDASGNMYVLVGNGDFDTTLTNGFPSKGDYGNAFLKISTTGGLAVADYFEMDNEGSENEFDVDLGSGGALVLPDMTDTSNTVRHLAVGAGKDGNLYLVSRDNMGGYNSTSNQIYQPIGGALPGGIWSAPAYYNNLLYYGPVGQPILAFQFSKAMLLTSPVAQTTNSFAYPGATPSVSAYQNIDGIVWATENTDPAVLHAYDATTLQEFYNSNQASGGRDQFGTGNKFITPTIAHGKVYVGTTSGVAVFGLLQTASSPRDKPPPPIRDRVPR